MLNLSEVCDYIFSDFQGFLGRGKISKKLVHQRQSDNVLVGNIVPYKHNRDVFIGEIINDRMHNFFYEHEQDHVPGMYLLEACRQFSTAVMHQFYDMPNNVNFILEGMQVNFYRYTEHDLPILNIGYFDNKIFSEKAKSFHKNGLSGVTSHCHIAQDNKTLAELSFQCSFMEIEKYSRMRQITIKRVKRRAGIKNLVS